MNGPYGQSWGTNVVPSLGVVPIRCRVDVGFLVWIDGVSILLLTEGLSLFNMNFHSYSSSTDSPNHGLEFAGCLLNENGMSILFHLLRRLKMLYGGIY